jgi:hypothetical protein
VAAAAAKRERITRTTETIDAEDDDEEASDQDAHLESPLFSPVLLRARRIETVGVRRTDPDSGYLGYMSPDVTETTLRAKWGGGTYRLEGKNLAGQVVKDGVRTCKIAGDPIFTSELEEKDWRRMHSLPAKEAPAAAALSVADMLRLIDEKDEKRRKEQADREERERKELAERETRDRLKREETEAQKKKDQDDREERRAKEQEEREDRRRKEAKEDEERRARVHREDMERMAAQSAAALLQTQQFFQQMAVTLQASHAEKPKESDPIKALMAGVQLAQALVNKGGGGDGGGGEPDSPLTALVKRLPETLAEARKTGGAMIAEMRAAGGGAPTGAPGGGRRDALTITGKLATKAKAVLLKLQQAGKDPEKEMDQLLTFAAAAIPDAPSTRAPARRPPQAAAPAAPAGPAGPARPARPARRPPQVRPRRPAKAR